MVIALPLGAFPDESAIASWLLPEKPICAALPAMSFACTADRSVAAQVGQSRASCCSPDVPASVDSHAAPLRAVLVAVGSGSSSRRRSRRRARETYRGCDPFELQAVALELAAEMPDRAAARRRNPRRADAGRSDSRSTKEAAEPARIRQDGGQRRTLPTSTVLSGAAKDQVGVDLVVDVRRKAELRLSVLKPRFAARCRQKERSRGSRTGSDPATGSRRPPAAPPRSPD